MRLTFPVSATNANDGVPMGVAPAFTNRNIDDMTLRDHYALCFMLQMLNTGAQKGDAPLAQMAVKRADALLIELERTEP